MAAAGGNRQPATGNRHPLAATLSLSPFSPLSASPIRTAENGSRSVHLGGEFRFPPICERGRFTSVLRPEKWRGFARGDRRQPSAVARCAAPHRFYRPRRRTRGETKRGYYSTSGARERRASRCLITSESSSSSVESRRRASSLARHLSSRFSFFLSLPLLPFPFLSLLRKQRELFASTRRRGTTSLPPSFSLLS